MHWKLRAMTGVGLAAAMATAMPVRGDIVFGNTTVSFATTTEGQKIKFQVDAVLDDLIFRLEPAAPVR